MTAELLSRGFEVTAIDRSPLDKRLNNRPGLTFVQADVATFAPPEMRKFDALLCDLNGPPRESIGHVMRLAPTLQPQGLVIFTLKVPRVETVDEPCAVLRKVVKLAVAAGLKLFAETHLTYNRHEFTLFFERDS